MVKLLYIDTTTDWIIVGFYELDNSQIECKYLYKNLHPREASSRLVGDIGKGLETTGWEKADIVSCAFGPGSFTGIRISVTVARDLAQVWNSKTFGFNSLEVYANYYYSKKQKPTLCLLDARMKKVYAGFIESNSFVGPFDIPPQELEKNIEIERFTIYSDFSIFGAQLYREDFPEPESIIKIKYSELLNLKIEEHNCFTLTPLYMRGTYAEGKKNGRNIK